MSLRGYADLELVSCCVGDAYASYKDVENVSVYKVYDPVQEEWSNLTGVRRFKNGVHLFDDAR